MKRRPTPPQTVPAAAASASPGLAWTDWLRPAEPFLIPLLVLIATRGLLWATIPIAAEDAYITFRYARHLAVGNGLVYNPGPPVMGFTSPLWTVWSALGWRLLHDPVTWARFWSVAGDVTTLVLVASMLRRHAGRAAAWAFAWFFAAWPFFSAVTVSGMETGVMLTLIVVAAALVERRSHVAGPALAALALMRPEGIAAAALIALGARWRDRAIALGLAGLGIGWLWSVFGSPIPQSVIAKAGIYGHPGPWTGRFWWDWFVPFPIAGTPKISEGIHLFLFSVLLAPAAVTGAPVAWRLRRSALGMVAGAALLVWLGYALLGVAYFFWYLVVPLAGVLVVAALGLPRIARGPALYVSAGLLAIGAWGFGLPFYLARAKFEQETFGAIAAWFGTHARPGEKVFLEPIGIIGYRNPLVVVDEVGLVSPDVARRRARGPGWYGDVIEAERPDWLVVRRGLLTRGATFAGTHAPLREPAELDSLVARYEVATTVTPEAGDQALVVLRRRR